MGTWISEVWQVHPTGRLARLGPCLGPLQAMIGEAVSQVAQAHLGAELGGEPRQSIRAPPRTDATGDADHNERIESEAVAIVHAPMFIFCSKFVNSPMRRVAAASDSVRPSFVNIACRSARDQDCACIHTGRALLAFRTVRRRDHQTCGLSVIATPAEWFPIPMR
jgi:hypothetical protein